MTTTTPHKAILEFDLMDPDGRSTFNDAVNGSEYRLVLTEIDSWMRNEIKHGSGRRSSSNIDGIEDVRKRLHELLSDRSLRID